MMTSTIDVINYVGRQGNHDPEADRHVCLSRVISCLMSVAKVHSTTIVDDQKSFEAALRNTTAWTVLVYFVGDISTSSSASSINAYVEMGDGSKAKKIPLVDETVKILRNRRRSFEDGQEENASPPQQQPHLELLFVVDNCVFKDLSAKKCLRTNVLESQMARLASPPQTEVTVAVFAPGGFSKTDSSSSSSSTDASDVDVQEYDFTVPRFHCFFLHAFREALGMMGRSQQQDESTSAAAASPGRFVASSSSSSSSNGDKEGDNDAGPGKQKQKECETNGVSHSFVFTPEFRRYFEAFFASAVQKSFANRATCAVSFFVSSSSSFTSSSDTSPFRPQILPLPHPETLLPSRAPKSDNRLHWGEDPIATKANLRHASISGKNDPTQNPNILGLNFGSTSRTPTTAASVTSAPTKVSSAANPSSVPARRVDPFSNNTTLSNNNDYTSSVTTAAQPATTAAANPTTSSAVSVPVDSSSTSVPAVAEDDDAYSESQVTTIAATLATAVGGDFLREMQEAQQNPTTQSREVVNYDPSMPLPRPKKKTGASRTCPICNVEVSGESNWEMHLRSDKHRRKEALKEAGGDPNLAAKLLNAENFFHCKVCNVAISGKTNVNQHLAGDRHRKNQERFMASGGGSGAAPGGPAMNQGNKQPPPPPSQQPVNTNTFLSGGSLNPATTPPSYATTTTGSSVSDRTSSAGYSVSVGSNRSGPVANSSAPGNTPARGGMNGGGRGGAGGATPSPYANPYIPSSAFSNDSIHFH